MSCLVYNLFQKQNNIVAKQQINSISNFVVAACLAIEQWWFAFSQGLLSVYTKGWWSTGHN